MGPRLLSNPLTIAAMGMLLNEGARSGVDVAVHREHLLSPVLVAELP
jgi:hypothetical protein